jgi:hypothetical protein
MNMEGAIALVLLMLHHDNINQALLTALGPSLGPTALAIQDCNKQKAKPIS